MGDPSLSSSGQARTSPLSDTTRRQAPLLPSPVRVPDVVEQGGEAASAAAARVLEEQEEAAAAAAQYTADAEDVEDRRAQPSAPVQPAALPSAAPPSAAPPPAALPLGAGEAPPATPNTSLTVPTLSGRLDRNMFPGLSRLLSVLNSEGNSLRFPVPYREAMVEDFNTFLEKCPPEPDLAGERLQKLCEGLLLPLLQDCVTPGGEVGNLQTLYEFAHLVAATSHTPLRSLLTHPGASTHVYGRPLEDSVFEEDRSDRRLFKKVIAWFTPETDSRLQPVPILLWGANDPLPPGDNLKNTRKQQFSALWALESEGGELATSLVASACAHCFAEISIISKDAAGLGPEGMHFMLKDGSSVSTQFSALVSHYINFTRRAAGVRGGFDRDMGRHIAAYQQQMFVFKDMRYANGAFTLKKY